MINTTEAMTSCYLTIDFIFMTKLWTSGAMFFKFYCNLNDEKVVSKEQTRERGEGKEKESLFSDKPFHQKGQHLNKFHRNFHPQYVL
jgi:hypothetical protein